MRIIIVSTLILCLISTKFIFKAYKTTAESIELKSEGQQNLFSVETRVINYLERFIEKEEENVSLLTRIIRWFFPQKKIILKKTVYSQLKKIWDQKKSKFLTNYSLITLAAVQLAIANVVFKYT